MRYALVKNGKVDSVIEADEEFIGSIAHKYDEVFLDNDGVVSVGFVRTPDGFKQDDSQNEPVIAPPRIITKLAFLRRFTVDEEIDLETASLDVPTGQPAARRAAARVRVAVRRLLSANYVDLDDPEVASTLQQFEAAGLLTAGRASAILSAPVQHGERVGA